MTEAFDTARLAVELGALPEAGGIEEQDPDLLMVMEMIRREAAGRTRLG